MISWDRERYSPFQIIYSEKDEMWMECDIHIVSLSMNDIKNKEILKIEVAIV